MNPSSRPRRPLLALLVFSAALLGAAPAFSADPYASNNGLYPDAKSWTYPFRTLNFAYPTAAVADDWTKAVPRVPLTTATAPAYAARLKEFVAPALRAMIETPNTWDPAQAGWYDMPWLAEGDAENGREALLGAFPGQVILKGTLSRSGLTVDMQNHTVIYYNARAATMLRKLWADPFNPDRRNVQFPEGSMVIKAAGASPTPAQWPILEGAAVWNVYRPPVDEAIKYRQDPTTPLHPQVTPLRLLQFDIIVKDSVASPQTGWVFTTFVHDKDARGTAPWDKLVSLGAMWGNDPQFAREPGGTDPKGGPLRESWINPAAPKYAYETLGWGGRMSGPIDVAERHNVIFTDGQRRAVARTSSCLSCHGTAQFPFVANLYPSPNRSFPPEGSLFMMYPPGSANWARWFENRPGAQAQNQGIGAVGLDYDMLVMFALASFDAAAGGDRYLQKRIRAH